VWVAQIGEPLDLGRHVGEVLDSAAASRISFAQRLRVSIGEVRFNFTLCGSMPDTDSIEQGARLKRELSSWISKTNTRDFQDRNFREAFTAFDKALIATITYMRLRRDGQPQKVEEETELTNLWQKRAAPSRQLIQSSVTPA
jgi:hypothetical protein